MSLVLGGLVACESYSVPPRAPSARSVSPPIAPLRSGDVPPPSLAYSTDAAAAGSVRGDSLRRVETALLRVLIEARGDASPRPDVRLAAVGNWLAARGAHAELRREEIDRVARRYGHVGPPPSVVLAQGGYDTPSQAEALVRKVLVGIPGNLPINRYAIVERELAGLPTLAILVASVELTLLPVPRHMSRRDTLRLAGSLAPRFSETRLAVTMPRGDVRTFERPGRDFTADLRLDVSGVYEIELLGDGPSGPVVVANFPVYVDTAEDETVDAAPAPSPEVSDDDAPLTPASVEERLLVLLNADRAKAHVGRVQPDDELAAVARSHSQDMADHNFFGHVSPTTGTPEDRLRRAHISGLLAYGENVVLAGNAQGAHQSLMDSPGHRGNMLRAEYTEVGIGAVVDASDRTGRRFAVTYVFAQRMK
jgi:uncharacterized protein YkwD